MTSAPLDAPAFMPGRSIGVVVVPVGDGGPDDRAIPVAAALAAGWRIPIQLLRVGGSISSVDPDLDAAAMAVEQRWPDLRVDRLHVYGDDPAVAVAGEIGASELAVVATDHADGWSFKHSVAEALVDRVGVPLILVGPRAARTDLDGDVVVALDGTPLAEVALAGAVDLARSLGRRLWLVRVVADPLPVAAADRALDRTHPELHPEVGLELQRLADRLDPRVEPRWEVIHGNDPVAMVEGFAAHVDAAFVVAATRGRADTDRTTMCSITMGLVAAAARPVLVVREGTVDAR